MTRALSIPDRFCRDVSRTIQTHDMVGASDAVLLAVSGGPDSMALVRVMMRLAPELEFRVGLAHLNHGLRGPDARHDQAFVQQFADAHGLPCFCETRDVAALSRNRKTSLEDAGRQARYDFFSRTAAANGYTCIATGHTRDDNAEQVLMALLRGSGPGGLAGIPAKRDDRIIRPLIDRSRNEIMVFLEDLEQTFVTDDSNRDPAFLRNRIRHFLIPLLEKEYNPGIKQGLDRLSRILAAEDDFLDEHARQAFDTCVEKKDVTSVVLSLPELEILDPALFPRVLRHAIISVKSDLHRITHDHISAIRHLTAHAAPGKHLDLPDRIRIYKTRNRICVKKESMPLRQLGRRQKPSGLRPPKA
jgi:tRNA(Ile)-lysidine synthase